MPLLPEAEAETKKYVIRDNIILGSRVAERAKYLGRPPLRGLIKYLEL